MISLIVNSQEIKYNGPVDCSLLDFLRNGQGIISVKDGCSGQGACGACLVEINGMPRLSCVTPMKKLEGAVVNTLEGIPVGIRDMIARWFVEEGAVQCGFCTPGFVMRTWQLLKTNPDPSIDEIRQALKSHLCRCTGYKKIEKAIVKSASELRGEIVFKESGPNHGVGWFRAKYQGFETAIGQRRFVNDMRFPGMLFGALVFSEHPRAILKSIDASAASTMPGVIGILSASDIPGNRFTGLIIPDWPLMIAKGETTCYIGDVIASVIADTPDHARAAAGAVKVTYSVMEPVTDMIAAMQSDSIRVHPDRNNLLETCSLKRGDSEKALADSSFIVKGYYQTQRIEHAFLETESCLALPDEDGLLLYSSGQGIYEDRRQVASVLGLPEEKIRVILVPSGGGFGGKEDLTVQGHAALAAWLLKRAVLFTLTREESIRMHPKRHPVQLDITLAADASGKLTAMKLIAIGDTGAYASVGTKVMERIAGHATGGYFVPNIDLTAHTVYTNNIPSGAMRGFGANQAAFALESSIDELCRKGGFDRWTFRWENALTDGLTTATGDHVKGAGIRACLEAVEMQFRNARFAGLACGIKNSGIGNGMTDYSDVIIEVLSEGMIRIHHGWTEMGQGVQTIAQQILCEETGISPDIVEVISETTSGIATGMTTSSRATVLLGNAIREASRTLNADLKSASLGQLSGRRYQARWQCDWTVKPDSFHTDGPTHYGYGYAAQVAVLNDQGKVVKVVAAHDAGRIINPVLFEGQIEGAVHMGLGYSLTENLPMLEGKLLSSRLRDCGVLRAHETPDIEVVGVEVPDPVGPYGAKGVGEIGLVPTAAAIANAFCIFDGVQRYSLPLKPIR